jgi:hypothetical protein
MLMIAQELPCSWSFPLGCTCVTFLEKKADSQVCFPVCSPRKDGGPQHGILPQRPLVHFLLLPQTSFKEGNQCFQVPSYSQSFHCHHEVKRPHV